MFEDPDIITSKTKSALCGRTTSIPYMHDTGLIVPQTQAKTHLHSMSGNVNMCVYSIRAMHAALAACRPLVSLKRKRQKISAA